MPLCLPRPCECSLCPRRPSRAQCARRALSAADATCDDVTFPILVVEVLSPRHARYDRGVKREACLALGIAEYWIVDIEAQVVDVWRSGDAAAVIHAQPVAWLPRTGCAPLNIDLPQLLGG